MSEARVIQELLALYKNGDAGRSVLAAKAADIPGASVDLKALCAAAFVDRGGELADQEAVERGIEIFSELVASEAGDPVYRNSLRYNLANGYGSLARCREAAGDMEGRLAAWKLERAEIQAVLLDRENVHEQLLPEILTNFGNALSYMGRKAESLDSYLRALAIRPNHPMAAGCAAQVTLDLLGIQPKCNALLLARAKELIDLALSNPATLRSIGGPSAAAGFIKTRDQIEVLASGMFARGTVELGERVLASRKAHIGKGAEGQAAGWAKSGLLLTVNPFPEMCHTTAVDDLFFDGLQTSAGEEGQLRFTLLAHTLNQIKEEYATSRYALLMSGRRNELRESSTVTRYADTLDYADFGLASGLLKTSMRLSIDLLDKVAVFLNRYIDLGLKEKSVSFATVWYEKADPNKGEGAELAKHLCVNGFLRGIRDVAETLNVFPAPAKDIRNRATHDFVIIENLLGPQVRLGGKVVTGDAHEFAEHLLKISRGVLIGLVAFVQRNEALNKAASGQTSVPMEFQYAQGISDELEGCC